MAEKTTKGLWQGIHTVPRSTEDIPPQSASDSSGWLSTDNSIELMRGRTLVGAELTDNGSVQGHWYWYKADGTTVHFRKINTKIQYYNTTTGLWVDIITGLTSWAEYTFSPYQSLAGAFMYVTGIDGIYKICTASPWDYASMYDSTKNFKGKSIIATGRMIMWDVKAWTVNFDKTGLYGSRIDAQNSTVYTTVSAEVIADTASGTLAFKAWDAKRTCFWVTITDTSSGEVFTDNYSGVLTGTLWGTGTINYMTGAFTTSQSGAGTADYQWEMTNNKWVTDFTKTATRLAAEWFTFRQDEWGDAIQKVTVHDGSYYSLKQRSVYKLTIDSTDLIATNIVFRKDIGMQYWRSSVTTGKGIIFMDTANREKPQLTILTPNAIGDNLEPVVLAKQFDFSNYEWDMCAMGTFGEYIVFSGRTPSNSTNDTLFFYNFRIGTIDILPYFAKTILEIEGRLYIGDTTTENVYEILSGFDDDNQEIVNYWISGDDLFWTTRLKKVKRFRIKWLITPSQKLEVYVNYDDSSFTQIGTILGNWEYVSSDSNPYTIWANGIGTSIIGGESSWEDWNIYFTEFHLSQGKFRKRRIKLVASGVWYVSVNSYQDFKIMLFEDRLPKPNRQKQNVSLDWTLTNQ